MPANYLFKPKPKHCIANLLLGYLCACLFLARKLTTLWKKLCRSLMYCTWPEYSRRGSQQLRNTRRWATYRSLVMLFMVSLYRWKVTISWPRNCWHQLNLVWSSCIHYQGWTRSGEQTTVNWTWNYYTTQPNLLQARLSFSCAVLDIKNAEWRLFMHGYQEQILEYSLKILVLW